MREIIYLAFINKSLPPFRQEMICYLTNKFPFVFESLKVDLNLKKFYAEERNQYNSPYILSSILNYLPREGAKIIGIINVDIYIPIFTFIFGEAQLNGKAALVSTYRLRNEFYGLPPDINLLYNRTVKETMHELGHTFGLIHCPNFECVMHFSTDVDEIDLKNSEFCRNCGEKLGNGTVINKINM